jgi:hypothetical protein
VTYRNAGLFSDHFLTTRLQQTAEWQATDNAATDQLRADLRAVLDGATPGLATANEAQTEQTLIRPVLDRLGHLYDVQAGLPAWGGRRVPDYAVFHSDAALAQSRAVRGQPQFWALASALLDAKGWNVGLDQPGAGGPGRTAGQQIAEYLRDSGLVWGVTTNGRLWRLYARATGRQATQYFEMDVEEAVADRDTLRLFALLFGPEGLRRDPQRERFCDLVLSGSLRYATDVGERLRARAFSSVESIARGFLRYGNHSDPTREQLDEVYANSLVLLYRLLFVLSAEARGLLPLSNPIYEQHHSLTAMRDEVLTRASASRFLPGSTQLYLRLTDLFELIDQGDTATSIPPYNGGLFNRTAHPFLTTQRCPDPELGQAIVDLAFDRDGGPQAIDYRDIRPRNLGTVYEGLLEYRLEAAAQPLTIGHRQGIEVYRRARANETPVVDAGEVYLRNDNNERRATGSYYTPDYIVDYMVAQSLEPLLAQLSAESAALIAAAPGNPDAARAASDTLLSLRVVDPAVGSGHFLVAAMHYIGDWVFTDPSFQPDEPDPEGRLLRRRIAERCLFGVDFNPLALELAKLTVWLETVAPDRPLSFLDHHIRFGNALIGARVDEIADLTPATTINLATFALSNVIPVVLGELVAISATDARTRDEIEEKADRANTARALLQPFHDLADYWLATRFGQQGSQADIDEAIAALTSGTSTVPAGDRWPANVAFARGMKAFHWELEFPEVFYAPDGGAVGTPGFDAIIGNPPYEVLETRRSDFAGPTGMTPPDAARYNARRAELSLHRRYFRAGSFPAETADGKLDYFRLFIERNLALVRAGGALAQIVPRSLLADQYAAGVRGLLWGQTVLERIDVFPKDPPSCWVFPDAELAVCVFVARRATSTGAANVREHPCRALTDGPFEGVTLADAQLLHPAQAPIPVVSTGERDLFTSIYARPLVARTGHIAPCHIGEINSQYGRPFFRDVDTGTLLIRGGDIGRHWVEERPDQAGRRWLDYQAFAAARGADAARPEQAERVVKQAVNDLADRRRIIAALLPPGRALQDSADYLVAPPPYDNAYLLAVLLCDANEWRFRMTSSNNNVNAYEVDHLFFPEIADWQDPQRSAALDRLLAEIATGPQAPNAALAASGRALAQGAPRAAVHDLAAALSREAQTDLGVIAGILRTLELTMRAFRYGNKLTQHFARGGWLATNDQGVISELQARRVETTLTERTNLLTDLAAARAAVEPLRQRVTDKQALAEALIHALLQVSAQELSVISGRLPVRADVLAPLLG